jgi:hypothetical protein
LTVALVFVVRALDLPWTCSQGLSGA